jgi:hypothetical protein
VSITSDHPEEAPPVGEEIHLPGPTLLPFLNAIGITFIVVGTTIGLLFLIAGGLLFVITTFLWIRHTRRDIDALPEEHQH